MGAFFSNMTAPVNPDNPDIRNLDNPDILVSKGEGNVMDDSQSISAPSSSSIITYNPNLEGMYICIDICIYVCMQKYTCT
jgi:hypothetical protein